MNKEEDTPRVWLVRAGIHGQDEEKALSQGLALIGYEDIGNLDSFHSPEEIAAEYQRQFPSNPIKRNQNFSRQLWAFKEGMRKDDIVVLPLKTHRGQVALGRVIGPYKYLEVGADKRHTREVKWIRPDVPRSTFKQDLLYSLGAFMTVCRITRNDAEKRILAVLNGHPEPGEKEKGEPEPPANIEDIGQAAHDEIVDYVRRKFQAHDMARLVEEILKAEGFITYRSAPGPDGGADILAGKGPFGLEQPTLCVQVKATTDPADVNIFRSLQGTMNTFGASEGLLVCWGGYKQAVRKEARQHIFKIRLWDQSDLVEAIYKTYDRLNAEIQAELPLKRVWALVHEEDLEEE